MTGKMVKGIEMKIGALQEQVDSYDIFTIREYLTLMCCELHPAGRLLSAKISSEVLFAGLTESL